MTGHDPMRRGGSSPLDVVGWFNDWLGRRRESLRSGGPRSPLPPGRVETVVAETRAILERSAGAISSGVFDRVVRNAVTVDERVRTTAIDLPLDADVDSQTGPGDLVEPASSYDWYSPPTHILRRRTLFNWLERWHRETSWDTLGDVGEFVRRPWLKVGIGAVTCHLNANTTRAGVAEYLAIVADEGPKLPWFVVSGRGRLINEVAVGRAQVRIRGFHLYTDSVFKQSGRIGGARPRNEDRPGNEEKPRSSGRRSADERSAAHR